jgi:predicted ArsR family transcriptional regulator
MAKQHIKSYLLDNSRRVTVKQVSKKVGISESAARNRLVKSRNPDIVYAPATSNGGRPKKNHQYKQVNKRPIDDPMFVLALKTI